jgi:hypothetical protein
VASTSGPSFTPARAQPERTFAGGRLSLFFGARRSGLLDEKRSKSKSYITKAVDDLAIKASVKVTVVIKASGVVIALD